MSNKLSKRTYLTPTDLLMEGVYTNYDPEGLPWIASVWVVSVIAI